MLENLGVNYVWNYQSLDKITYNAIKQRLLDSTNQELMMSINTSTKLQSYCIFKVDTEQEPYLDTIKQPKFKFASSNFRLSSHPFYIETGRYTGIPKEERFCVFCIMRSIENECHFLMICPHYVDIRRKYLPAYYCRWPTITKFKIIMQTKSRTLINNIAKFIYFALKRRNLV